MNAVGDDVLRLFVRYLPACRDVINLSLAVGRLPEETWRTAHESLLPGLHRQPRRTFTTFHEPRELNVVRVTDGPDTWRRRFVEGARLAEGAARSREPTVVDFEFPRTAPEGHNVIWHLACAREDCVAAAPPRGSRVRARPAAARRLVESPTSTAVKMRVALVVVFGASVAARDSKSMSNGEPGWIQENPNRPGEGSLEALMPKVFPKRDNFHTEEGWKTWEDRFCVEAKQKYEEAPRHPKPRVDGPRAASASTTAFVSRTLRGSVRRRPLESTRLHGISKWQPRRRRDTSSDDPFSNRGFAAATGDRDGRSRTAPYGRSRARAQVAMLLRGVPFRDWGSRTTEGSCCEFATEPSIIPPEALNSGNQLDAVRSWKEAIIEPAEALGYEVDVFVATYHCANGRKLVENTLLPALAPYVRGVYIGAQENSSQFSVISRLLGLAYLEATTRQDTDVMSRRAYEHVFIMRLDRSYNKVDTKCLFDSDSPANNGWPAPDTFSYFPGRYFECAVRHRWEPGLANSYESLHLIMAMSGEPFGRPPDGKKYLNIPVFTKANGEPETAPFINDKNPRLIAPCWRQGLGQHHGWKVGADRLTSGRYMQARGLAGEQATRWKANVTRACFRLRSKADWALIGE